MSRIGNMTIQIPAGVTVNLTGGILEAQGPKGTDRVEVRPEVKVEIEGNEIKVSRKKEDKFSKSLHGLTRSIINNLITGVNTGWEKRLELVGVGFRANTTGEVLNLAVGYSHPVEIKAVDEIQFSVEDNTKILVTGINKIKVGQMAANIRKVRPPEPYQGKGIRYSGEYVRRKAGKAGKVGAK